MIEVMLLIPFIATAVLWGYYHAEFKQLERLQAELKDLYELRLTGEKAHSDALKRRIAILEKIVSSTVHQKL